MTWTKKHEEFALTCGLTRQSVERLLRWILRRAKLSDICEIEIDLRKFNRWIEKIRGKGYDRKTLREAIEQLDEQSMGMVTIIKKWNPWDYKILVRPLFFVEKRNSQFGETVPKLPTGKPMFDADHKKRLIEQQQQDISKIESLTGKLGLRFTRDALVKLWRMAGKSVSDIQKAVEMMIYSNSTQEQPIKNACGWLYDCLRYGWYEEYDPYYQAQLPIFQSVKDIEQFVGGLIPQPT